jgi:uncharacterized protein YndB with AHSA1/START domain
VRDRIRLVRQILHAVHIHASPSSVYDAITTAKGLRGWWTKKVEAEERVGGVIRFTFAGDFNPQMKQTTLEKPRLVAWQCIGGHSNWQERAQG